MLQKIFPYLCAELSTSDLIPFILPNIFLIAEQSTNDDFTSTILPHIAAVFEMEKPYQVLLD